MSMAPLLGLPGKVTTLLSRLTSARATNLDNLDATTSSRAAAATALSSATYTSARAGYLDKINTFLDADTGIMEQKFQVLSGSGTWTRPAGIVGTTVMVSAIAGGEAYSTVASTGGMGGSYVQNQPYAAGASIAYACGAGGTYSAGDEDGSNTTIDTTGIVLIGGGASGCSGADGSYSSTVVLSAQAPGGPYGAFAPFAPRVGRGGGGLRLGDTVYGAGGSGAGGSGVAGGILLQWWEYV